MKLYGPGRVADGCKLNDMLHTLKRHPVSVSALFRHSLVLTYALPGHVLEPLLPPGLALDTYGEWGFVAVALVQTESLRPSVLPAILGQDFFLAGYRIFSRYTALSGRRLRGLRILRSDTNRRLMAVAGNLLTHYNYRVATTTVTATQMTLNISVRSGDAQADVDVTADIATPATCPPAGSPFPDLRAARAYAGPLPFTFDYEPQTHSVILIEGVRRDWHPTPVHVDVKTCTFLESTAFQGVQPILANAFYLTNIPYRWLRGRRERLPA